MMMSSERVLPVGCRDCQYVEMGVCVCPWVCWEGIGEEMETPGVGIARGHSELKRHSQWQRQGNYERK